MANRHRGEIDAELGGQNYTLCLTLGALAELESAYGDEDLIAIAERFEKGRIGATDAIRVIGAGLRGTGNAISNDEVAAMTADGGAAGFLAIVARLLTATFAPPEETQAGNAGAPRGKASPGGA
ncbi:MAG: gene transfer agent family protein [Rhizobiales bacterium]|nr:gene transfer agent family protein [Hyphomicrobiales bacterium]MBI3672362.1 gene transfer agent family protein [Hyphomicrobiales bacterium]